MATDKIDDAIFSIILQIRKNNNRADVNSIHKHIIKIVDFEYVTKEYLDERIHTLITDGKIINKINRNADSHYLNEKDIESILWLDNTSTCLHVRFNSNSSHHQLQYALGSFGLITQAHASMYVSTLIQVIISCSTHWAPLA